MINSWTSVSKLHSCFETGVQERPFCIVYYMQYIAHSRICIYIYMYIMYVYIDIIYIYTCRYIVYITHIRIYQYKYVVYIYIHMI